MVTVNIPDTIENRPLFECNLLDLTVVFFFVPVHVKHLFQYGMQGGVENYKFCKCSLYGRCWMPQGVETDYLHCWPGAESLL